MIYDGELQALHAWLSAIVDSRQRQREPTLLYNRLLRVEGSPFLVAAPPMWYTIRQGGVRWRER
jgi:hypothetical protein